MKDYMLTDSQQLLELMGLPWIQAPGEGEAQAAHLNRKGDADYCASQDYDSLTFWGAQTVAQRYNFWSTQDVAKVFIEVVPEVIELNKALSECELNHEQLIDVGILIGTDFNPDGIKASDLKPRLNSSDNTVP